MNYLYIKDNKIVSKGKLECLSEGVLNIEVSDEIFNNSEKYVFKNGEIVLDCDYEKKILVKQNANKREAILEELKNLDFKTIRALRANETERIMQYEAKAKSLRAQAEQLNV